MFKKCQNCEQIWRTLISFISDKNIRFIGYQARFDQAREGLFLFNHSCKTTLAIKLTEFEELSLLKLSVISFSPPSSGCPGHCADASNLKACGNTDCQGKPIRDLIQILKVKCNRNQKKSA